MRRIAVREYGRVHRVADDRQIEPGVSGVSVLPVRLYERLRRFDAQRDEDAAVFTWHASHARAQQWVGVIELDGLRVEVLPKIGSLDDTEATRGLLVWMLAYAGEVPVRLGDVAALSARSADIGELIAAAFAERLLRELLVGAERAYVSRRENLQCLRGKLAISTHIRQNAAHREKFVCDHDELVTNTPLNQILLATCGLLAGSTRSTTTLDRLGRCGAILDGVAEVHVTAQLFGEVRLHRHNQRYEPLLALCRMLFEGQAPTTDRGPNRTFSLLFDMNHLFERFLAGFFAREVMPHLPGWRLHVQAKNRSRFLLTSGGKGVLQLKPDMILERPDGSLLILDAKWKRLTPGRERSTIARDDLYQLYAYGQRYESDRNVLLYPWMEGLQDTTLHVLRDVHTQSDSRIDATHIDLRALGSREARADLAARMLARIQ